MHRYSCRWRLDVAPVRLLQWASQYHLLCPLITMPGNQRSCSTTAWTAILAKHCHQVLPLYCHVSTIATTNYTTYTTKKRAFQSLLLEKKRPRERASSVDAVENKHPEFTSIYTEKWAVSHQNSQSENHPNGGRNNDMSSQKYPMRFFY